MGNGRSSENTNIGQHQQRGQGPTGVSAEMDFGTKELWPHQLCAWVGSHRWNDLYAPNGQGLMTLDSEYWILHHAARSNHSIHRRVNVDSDHCTSVSCADLTYQMNMDRITVFDE